MPRHLLHCLSCAILGLHTEKKHAELEINNENKLRDTKQTTQDSQWTFGALMSDDEDMLHFQGKLPKLSGSSCLIRTKAR